MYTGMQGHGFRGVEIGQGIELGGGLEEDRPQHALPRGTTAPGGPLHRIGACRNEDARARARQGGLLIRKRLKAINFF